MSEIQELNVVATVRQLGAVAQAREALLAHLAARAATAQGLVRRQRVPLDFVRSETTKALGDGGRPLSIREAALATTAWVENFASVPPSVLSQVVEAASLAHLLDAQIPVPVGAVEQFAESMTAAVDRASREAAVLDLLDAAAGSERALTHGLLAASCTRGGEALGFTESAVTDGAAGLTRVVLIHPEAPVSLVLEIAADGTSLEVETVGLSDGRCADVLAAWRGALAEEGVEVTLTRRRFTGGVAVTNAAQEFLDRTGAALKPMAAPQKRATRARAKVGHGRLP